MMKKLLSIISALSIAVSALPVFAENAEDSAEPNYGFGYEHKVTAEPIMFLDFEEYNMGSGPSGFSSEKACVSLPAESWDGSAAYTLSGSGQPTMKFDTIDSGAYLLSFDIKRRYPESWTYLRWNWNGGSGTLYDTFGMMGGKIGYNSNWSVVGVPFTADEWQHVNMFIDFDKKKIDYYINNEYVTQSTSIGSVSTLCFIVEGAATQVTSLDNIAMFKMNTDLRTELVNLGINMPVEQQSDFDVEINSKYDGNLFTSFDEVELNINLKNKLDVDMKYDMSWYVTAYNGDKVCEGEEKGLTLGASAEFTHKLVPEVDKYDIYTLYLTIDPEMEGSATIERDKEFSIASVPTPGYKCDYFGACTHPGRWTNWHKVQHAVDVSGIGYLRTDYGWGSYERSKGVYGGKGEAENTTTEFYSESAALGIENIGIFTILNGLYAASYKELSQSEEGLAALEKAAESYAREYTGRIDVIELGNELNFARVEVMSPEEYAVCSAAAYRGIKKGNPDAIVLSQGISRNAGDWAYRYLTAVDEPVCDALAIHVYQEAGTPEQKKWDDYCKEVRDSVDRAGFPEMELWCTEGNTSAFKEYSTEQQHGVNLIRQLARVHAYHSVDRYLVYQLQTNETNQNDQESYFGILRGPWVNNANGPKQSYMATTNYLARTENTEFESDITYDDNVWIYRFKKTDSEKRVLMMYADRDTETVTLNLGTNSGTLYDINGNPTELKSTDGKFTFTFSEQPMYFEYTGESFEKCEDKVTVDQTVIEVTKGDTKEFNLTVPEGAKVTMKNRDNVTAELTQNGTDVKIKFTVNEMPELVNDPALSWKGNVDYTERHHDFGTQIFRDHIEVSVSKDGKTFADLKLPMEYVFDSADVTMTVRPYDNTNTKYWKGVVTIKNNTIKPIAGTVRMTSPTEIVEEVGTLTVPEIQPGESTVVEFNIPVEYSHGYHYYEGIFTTTEGEEIDFALGDTPRSYGYTSRGTVALGTIEKTKNKTPVIDGVLDEDEWKDHKITSFDKSQVTFGSQGNIVAGVVEGATFGEDADYGGMADFSGTVYAQWDDEYFYAAALVYDDVHWQKQDFVRAYYDDHFYYVIKPTTTQRHDTRIEFFLSDFYDNDKFPEEDKHGMIDRNWSQMFDVSTGGRVHTSEDGPQVKVVRKENVTIYETRMPLDQIFSPETLAQDYIQANLTFQLRDYDGDRDKTWGWGGWMVFVDTAE